MSTYIDAVNDVVDTIIDTLDENGEILLYPTVIERFDKPAIIANTVSEMPIWYVMPLIQGDGVRILMDDESSLHSFQVDLEGYYWFETNSGDSSDLRYARNILFEAAELFKGKGSVVGSGHIANMTAKPSVFMIGDKVIHRLSIGLKVTMYN